MHIEMGLPIIIVLLIAIMFGLRKIYNQNQNLSEEIKQNPTNTVNNENNITLDVNDENNLILLNAIEQVVEDHLKKSVDK